MGTRSTYRVIEEWTDDREEAKVKKGQNKLVLLYAQFDGYPEGHPMDTAKWLASGRVVNGLRLDEKGLMFNGAGCLAAQLVAKYKDSAGGYYLHPMNHRGHCWENYTYDIIVKEDGSIEYICYEVGGGYGGKSVRFKKLFQGSPEDFIEKFSEVEADAE
jgi:hypothetical protein